MPSIGAAPQETARLPEYSAMELDPDQQSVVDHIVQLDFSVLYVIGPPGYGKTAALRKAIRRFQEAHPDKKVCMTGTTSVAAVLLRGSGIEATTLHSWLQIAEDSLKLHNETLIRQALEEKMPAAPRETDLLIIDEASMFTVQNLAILDVVLRWYRGNQNTRFGGLKIVLVGDPPQLPPVSPTNGPGLQRNERAHVTSCLQTLDDHRAVIYMVLRHPHRCDDREFQKFLRGFISLDSDIREQSLRIMLTKYQRKTLRTPHDVARYALEIGAQVIAYTNEDVADCNAAFRMLLSSRPFHTFPGPVRLFTDEQVQTLPLDNDADPTAELYAEEQEITHDRKRFFEGGTVHEGQRVQIRANHTSVNGVPVYVGDVCIFTGRDDAGNACMTRKRDGKELVITKHVAKSEYWKELEWTGYPFIAADAATVHLMQGNTIEGPVIFFVRSLKWDFHGNLPYILYVALSRVTNPANLHVSRWEHDSGVHALAWTGFQQALDSMWSLDFMVNYPRV